MKPAHILPVVACLLLLAAYPAAADIADIPSLPAQFSGTIINHEGKPFPAGTVITAEVNGITSTYTITEAGKLGGSGTFDDKFLISGVTAGDTITFRIEGTDVSVTHTYTPASTEQTAQIQLTIPVEIPKSSDSPSLPEELPPAENEPPLPTTPDSGNEPSAPSEKPDDATTPAAATSPAPVAVGVLALLFAAVRRK